MLRLASWPRLVAGVAIAGSLLAPRDALAFCRTTTVKSTADYDASSLGCWNKGVPLFWRNTCVGYSIARNASKKVSYADAADALSTAFTRWTGATCPTEGSGTSRVSIDVRDLGPADCAKVEYVSGAANQNVILFRDDSWAYGKTVLGLTTVVYNPTTGEIYGADMEINTLDMDPLAVHDPVASDAYDFQSVVTHEAGHFLGMAHSDVLGATMYARYNPGQTNMRYLAPDDITGICTVYRPDGDRAVLTGKVTSAPQCDPTPRGGYSAECQEASSCKASIAGRASRGPAYGAAVVAIAALARCRRLRRARASSR